MNFIKTKNFKNMLNSFYDSVTAGNPTEFSNDADVDHGHNVISIGGVTANGKIYSADSSSEMIWQFASNAQIRRNFAYYAMVDNVLTQMGNVSGNDDGYYPIGVLENISNVRSHSVNNGFYDRANSHTIGEYTYTSGLIFIGCTDSNITDDKNTPSGNFKILKQVGSTIYNKGKNIYTLIDTEDGALNINSLMVLYDGSHRYAALSPVIIGGVVLNSPITLGNGTTFTVEIDWGLNPIT